MTAGPGTEPLPDAIAGLRGCRVTRFVIDDSLTLALHGPGREVLVRIDGEGRLERGGQAYRFSPDEDPAGLAPLLSLMSVRLESPCVAADGSLQLHFEDGARLTALPDDHQVSWSVRILGGASACCIAEGKVVWQ